MRFSPIFQATNKHSRSRANCHQYVLVIGSPHFHRLVDSHDTIKSSQYKGKTLNVFYLCLVCFARAKAYDDFTSTR